MPLLATPELRDDGPLLHGARDLVRALSQRDPDTLRALVRRGTLTPRRISLALEAKALASNLGVPIADLSPDLLEIEAPVSLRRRGVEAKLVVGDPAPSPDPRLLRTLLEAHRWAAALRTGTPLTEIARNEGHRAHHIRSCMGLAFLSPKIQRAICTGTQPVDLYLERLVRQTLPLDWAEQERQYGFA